MRSVLKRKLKQNRAFTLIEMLLVVAMITILSGISVLGISKFSGSLEQMELDNYAKAIYMEAQNQLTAKEVEGGLGKLQQDLETSYSDQKLSVKPHDYIPYGDEDETWKNYYYLSGNEELAKKNHSTYNEHFSG